VGRGKKRRGRASLAEHSAFQLGTGRETEISTDKLEYGTGCKGIHIAAKLQPIAGRDGAAQALLSWIGISE
jgi:hypothetical protein